MSKNLSNLSIFSHFITLLLIISYIWCIEINEMTVPSILLNGENAVLKCTNKAVNENETFIDIKWHKLVDNKWQLIKVFPKLSPETPNNDETVAPIETTTTTTTIQPKETVAQTTAEPETVETTAPTTASPKSTANENTEKPMEAPPKRETQEKLFTLNGLNKDSEDSNIEIPKVAQIHAGLYKCTVRSSIGSDQRIQEMKVIYKPIDETKPIVNITKNQDSHIHFKCMAPASNPMSSINFFVNAEPVHHENIHRLQPIKDSNTSDFGDGIEVITNVEEIRIKATKQSVLNNRINIVCTATLANYYHSSAVYDMEYNGPLLSDNGLSAAMIILIIVVIVVVLIIIVVVIWIIMRKKKINAMNKVSELFNKPKTVTVLVDNQKVE